MQGELGKKTLSVITAQLALEPRRVFQMQMPLGLGYVYGLEDKIPASVHSELTFQPFKPKNTPMVDLAKPMRAQIEGHDVLLVYPYESMTPLLRLVREASTDEACISIKITLYRVAKSSHLCESLIQAAEEGKDVTVLMELRARFDEENNIAWAERLQEAGCTVIYGAEGFKCHSKICQITYHDPNGVSRITCLGTGNFNEKTARLYSDFMLMTAHPGIAADGNVFFRNLSLGNLKGSYNYLGVAPYGLKPLVMGGLDREIERARAGLPAQVFMKMNSLTDRDVIDKIAEACEAGVRVVMIIRGICCIRANVPGRTDGLIVRQIVGRFLEHARIYAKIQQMRFGSRISVEFGEVPDTVRQLLAPRLILQPVLENAFEHGMRDVVEGGLIRVRFYDESGSCVITVEDNSDVLSEADLNRLIESMEDVAGEVTALKNICHRLKLRSDDGLGFELLRSPLGGLCVRMIIRAEVRENETADRG